MKTSLMIPCEGGPLLNPDLTRGTCLFSFMLCNGVSSEDLEDIIFSFFSLSSRVPFPNFSCNPLSNPFSRLVQFFFSSSFAYTFRVLDPCFSIAFSLLSPILCFPWELGLCGGAALTMGKSYESKMDETRPRLRAWPLPTDLRDLCCPCWLCPRTKLWDEGRGVIMMDSCFFFC